MVGDDGAVQNVHEEPESDGLRLGGFEDDLLVSPPTASSATMSLHNLSSAVSGSRGMPMGNAHKTLEDLVKELVRPMLKDWLDTHLASIVHRIVEREVSRLANRADQDDLR